MKNPRLKVKLLCLFCFCLLSLAACGQPTINSPTALPPTPTAAPPTSTSEPQPTATASQSPTSTSTLTPTATPANCPEYLVVDSIKKAIPSGIFMIFGPIDLDPSTLLDIKTGQTTSLQTLYPDIEIDQYAISPDRKRIALVDIEIGETFEETVWIVTPFGTVLTQFEPPAGWHEVSWINDHLIGIAKVTREWDDVMLTYDLQTGKSSLIVPPFRDLYQDDSPLSWRISYSPDLRWMAYINNNDYTTVVVNLENNQIIWKSVGESYHITPQWTRSGDKLVISDSAVGLYILSRDGESRLFPIPESIQTNPNYFKYFDISALSPDDRYLAAWVNTKIKEEIFTKLLILDLKTNQVLDFCLIADFENEILWSPDSTGLITSLENNLPDGSMNSGRVYLDLAAKKVIEFPTEPPFYGWLSSVE